MARAFTPSRSMIYGQPDRQALVGIGRTIMGQLQEWSAEEAQAEYVRQTSNAQVALMRERHGLFSKLVMEQAHDPDSWGKTLLQNNDRIRKSVLAGVTQPRAKQAVALEVSAQLARWEIDLAHAASVQKGRNAEINYETNRDSILSESREYANETEALADLESAFKLVDANHNPGGLPAHEDVATPEAAEFQKRRFARHIVGNYLLQQALAANDETVIDEANTLAPQSIFDDQGEKPLFGPDELGELRQRFKAAQRLRQQRQADEMAVNDREMTAKVLRTLDGSAAPEETVRPSDVTAAMLKGAISEEAGKWMHGMLTRENVVVDPQAAVAMEIINDRVATGQMDLREAVGHFQKISADLPQSERNKYYAELIGEHSTWRATLRTKARGIIDKVTAGAEGLLDDADNVAASEAAQLRFYNLLREAEAKNEPLTEDRFLPLAISIAEQVQDEREVYGIDWVKARYLTPATAPNETVKKEIRYVRLDTGEEYLNGVPTGRRESPEPTATAETPEAEPPTREAFLREVARLKAKDMTAARKYYDTWAPQFAGTR